MVNLLILMKNTFKNRKMCYNLSKGGFMDNKLNEFLIETKKYNIFSYRLYKRNLINKKLNKIKLLNEYLKLKFPNNDEKIDIFIDFDGVILDTINYTKDELLRQHNIDLYSHNRDNIENDKIVSTFFKNIDWETLIKYTPEINSSIKFINLIKDSNIYNPIIYSAVNSEKEEKVKNIFIKEKLHNVEFKTTNKPPKKCTNDFSVLIDDDDYNLKYWSGYPIHFNSNPNTIFPGINDLGEIYYLFSKDKNGFIYPDHLYSDLKKEEAFEKRLKWVKKL